MTMTVTFVSRFCGKLIALNISTCSCRNIFALQSFPFQLIVFLKTRLIRLAPCSANQDKTICRQVHSFSCRYLIYTPTAVTRNWTDWVANSSTTNNSGARTLAVTYNFNDVTNSTGTNSPIPALRNSLVQLRAAHESTRTNRIWNATFAPHTLPNPKFRLPPFLASNQTARKYFPISQQLNVTTNSSTPPGHKSVNSVISVRNHSIVRTNYDGIALNTQASIHTTAHSAIQASSINVHFSVTAIASIQFRVHIVAAIVRQNLRNGPSLCSIVENSTCRSAQSAKKNSLRSRIYDFTWLFTMTIDLSTLVSSTNVLNSIIASRICTLMSVQSMERLRVSSVICAMQNCPQNRKLLTI